MKVCNTLYNQGIYYYVTSAGSGTFFLRVIVHSWRAMSDADFSHAIDPEVIKMRTNVPSETSQKREDFRTRLLERDA